MGTGSAVGIASHGIHICQGLLSYYHDWKDSKADISTTYDLITDLSRTLISLKASLEGHVCEEEKIVRVKSCVESCEDSLLRLSAKLQELQRYGQPESLRQKAWSELQRLAYPFKKDTLVKLQDNVNDVKEQLELAVQILHLGISTGVQKSLTKLEDRVEEISTQNISLLATHQSDRYAKIAGWLSSPDPWSNHNTARQRYEPETGAWLLQSPTYRDWKSDLISHIWFLGKAGCGKTVLCSTVIEDIRVYCDHHKNVGLAVYYFTFSDKEKQTYDGLIRSLIAQLGIKEPGLSMLEKVNQNAGTPSRDDLEKILLSVATAYKSLFLIIDALDESPEENGSRDDMLLHVRTLAQSVPGLKIFATSREQSDIRDWALELEARQLFATTSAVDADIRKYVRNQLLGDSKLSRLDTETKSSVEHTIAQKADGMFRWAYCQLQELRKLKSLRPSYVRKALHDLPPTLDETYTLMLSGIDEMYRTDALTLLRWIAYAQSPLSLGQLVETVIINVIERDVDFDDRGNIEDTLNLLSSLITVIRSEEDYDDSHSGGTSSVSEDDSPAQGDEHIKTTTKVRLAHFSVKEFLESKRILDSRARGFYLESTVAHKIIAQSCLTYILHYSKQYQKTSTEQDLITFPLLDYSAKSWSYHSSLQPAGDVNLETELLTSSALRDWLLISRTDQLYIAPFSDPRNIGSALYYASSLGLPTVVRELISHETTFNVLGNSRSPIQHTEPSKGNKHVVLESPNTHVYVNLHGGPYGSALQAASVHGHKEIIAMLLDAGADPNVQGGRYGNALQAAARQDSREIVQMLLDAGADPDAQGGRYGNALQAAASKGCQEIVQMLLDAGVDPKTQGGEYDTALQAAALTGSLEVIQLLLEVGAEVNAQGGRYGNALQAASAAEDKEAVQMLLNAGANVNLEGGYYGNALQAASSCDDEELVQMLLDAGADANVQGGVYGSALYAAIDKDHREHVRILLDAGADANIRDGMPATVLQIASFSGYKEIVQMLLNAGADVNAQGGEFGTALQAALRRSNNEVLNLLLFTGVDVVTLEGFDGDASRVAAAKQFQEIVRILLNAGADVNTQEGSYSYTLQTTLQMGNTELKQMLLEAGAKFEIHEPPVLRYESASEEEEKKEEEKLRSFESSKRP